MLNLVFRLEKAMETQKEYKGRMKRLEDGLEKCVKDHTENKNVDMK